jgi:hypothetical protein
MSKILLLSSFIIPLTSPEGWKNLSYSSIPKHKSVEYKDTGLKIKINKSAMPLIYPFKQSKKIKSLTVTGFAHSIPKLNKSLQGSKGNDDYILRVGLVLKGKKTLNWFQKSVSPKWVTTLFSLAPKNQGVDKIEFYNIYQDKRLKNISRVHPLGKGLLEDINVYYQASPGKFSFKKEFKNIKDVLAVWISTDGDDTGSKFEIEINEIKIN